MSVAEPRTVNELMAARQAAIQAEHDRLAKETENEREIEALDRQIAEAKINEANTAFEQSLPESRRLAELVERANNDLKEAIQARNLPDAIEKYSACVEAWKTLEDYNRSALGHIANIADAIFQSNLNDAHGQNIPLARSQWRKEYSGYVFRLAWGVRPIEYLTGLATRGHIERGMVLSITGFVVNPTDDYNAATVTQRWVGELTGLNRVYG